MAAETVAPPEFDPLVEFYGMWNTELAEHYLPIPWTHARKYECVGGFLVMSPAEGTTNGYGEVELGARLRVAVKAAGLHLYPQTNLRFNPDSWIVPDLTILRESARGAIWVQPDNVLMAVEFVSPSSRRRDRIDKPRLCAEAGIPWHLRVELDYPSRSAYVRLDRLDGDRYTEFAAAHGGQRFTIADPFRLDFDPVELLEP